MADYYASTRTNWFRVNDLGAFLAYAAAFDAEVIQDTDGRVAVLDTSEHGRGIARPDEATGTDVYMVDTVAPFLAPDSVYVETTVGGVKLQHLEGWATAKHPDGRSISIELGEAIINAVKTQWGVEVTGPTGSGVRVKHDS